MLSCAERPFLKYLLFMLSLFFLPSQKHILLQRSDVWELLPGFHSAHRATWTHIPQFLAFFFLIINPGEIS